MKKSIGCWLVMQAAVVGGEAPDASVTPPRGEREILFSCRPGGENHDHSDEMRRDGSELRQLTDGAFGGIEPSGLPDGDIVLASNRDRRWENCWATQVATPHRCDRGGGNLRARKNRPGEIKRFDMPGFRPRPEWAREMKSFGILPVSSDPSRDPIESCQTERACRESLHHQPAPESSQ